MGKTAILVLFKRFQNPPTSISKDNQHIILKTKSVKMTIYGSMCIYMPNYFLAVTPQHVFTLQFWGLQTELGLQLPPVSSVC